MRKFLSLLLALVMVLWLHPRCGGDGRRRL